VYVLRLTGTAVVKLAHIFVPSSNAFISNLFFSWNMYVASLSPAVMSHLMMKLFDLPSSIKKLSSNTNVR